MKLLFLGDMFYDYPWGAEDMEEIVQYINENDYRIVVNFETAIGKKGAPIKKRGPNLRSTDVVIDILKRMNCVAVCLANNHAMDFGVEALIDAKAKLENAGILCVGAGATIKEAIRPVELQIDGVSLALFNFGWNIEETVYATENSAGCAPLNRKEIPIIIKNYKEKSPNTKIIGIFHWGFEFNTLPMPVDVAFAHDCIDAGCDLIVGHHPHVIQPTEQYADKQIFYSIGNFYFGTRRSAFPEGYSNEMCPNYGDYGIGVLFDVADLTTDHITVYYERSEDFTRIIARHCDVLTDLAACDWESEAYSEKARLHAYKNNPILGLDEKENKQLISKLVFKYKIAAMLSFLKTNRIGAEIYNFLKSKA